MTEGSQGRILALASLVLVAGAGCQDAFEPYRSSDLHYSIFGYLDASADTQWIRVSPLRQSVLTTPEKLHATVTLEDLETGITTELHDSVFQFQTSVDVEGAAGSFVHNYWTDVPLRYSATYRVSVVGANGETTTATASIPDEMREVVVEERKWRYFVRVQSQHAPLVEVIYYVAEHVPVDPYRLPGVYTDCPLPHDPFFRVFPVRQIFPQDVGIDPAGVDLLARKLDPRLLETGVETPAACVVNRRDILIASPGFDWPTGVQFLPSTPVLGPVPSSIQGGTGFLGGLATRTVPFESCTEPSCVLRYNDQSATVEGVVTDSRCGTPVEGATVELSAPGAPGRTTTTEQDGRYRIGALGGGTTYAVLVTQPLWWPPGDPYARRAYEDLRTTITAQVATTTTRNLVLQRQVACP